jgi:hypothetical protein
MRTSVRVVEMTPSQKGAIAEAEIQAAAVRLHWGVLLPTTEGHRYDLALDDGNRLLRVQCKWARRRGDVIWVRIRTSRFTPSGYVTTVYTRDEVDAIGVYCPDVDRCYLIPIGDVEGQGFLHLRLAPTRNNQATGVKWAAQYEFGAIAQLGERLAGSQKVGGSSPPGSTDEQAAPPGGLFAL